MYDNFNNCSLSGAGMTLFSVSNKNFDSNKYKQFFPIDTGIEIVS